MVVARNQDLPRLLLDLTHKEPGLTIQELVARACQASGAPPHLVVRSLYRLKLDDKVHLEDPHPPIGVRDYLRSNYGIWLWAMFVLIFGTGVAVYVLPQGPPFIYLRYVLGSLFVLYLPGYALIEALYPKKGDLEGLERLALSIGLSLALVPLVGLILNYTPWGIRLDPVLASLALVTTALLVTAAFRKVGYIRLTHTTS